MPNGNKHDTGHGATLTFGTQSFTAKWTEIGELRYSGGSVEKVTLDMTGNKEYLPEDLAGIEEMTVNYLFDSEFAAEPTKLGAAETITITLPTATGQSAAATIAGTGFITSATCSPRLMTNELQVGSITIQFDGGTGPTFTLATTTTAGA